DVDRGEWIDPVLRHEGELTAVEFSPSGDRVLTASRDRSVWVWDTTTGAPSTPPLLHGRPVSAARFSSDGKRILSAASPDAARMPQLAQPRAWELRLWDGATGLPLTPP